MSLIIKNLSVNLRERQILKEISLEVAPGTLHAIMGPNGGGKSTLSAALLGNSAYTVTDRVRGKNKPQILVDNKDITGLPTDMRAKLGLFLAFQSPISIPGVNVANLLKTAYQLSKEQRTKNHSSRHKEGLRARKDQKKLHNPALSVWEFNEMLVKEAKKLSIPQDFLRRSLNEAFSGGEKKKLEMLQAVILSPKYAVFDEIDTGLDVDALKIVATGIEQLKKKKTGVIVITHYQRILKYARPDFVHILVGGRIVASGNRNLAKEVEENGYRKWADNN
ncbi:Fe-S cluster assembly ATPase SufC [Patescibacteria group bacterium]|nr:Fe-S cluster assembly ATPase SufC [Patescibacteria group bacterium]MCL5797289.1 Fe-S cluster assembly ATPase SufC [Patescibacteria group bacterium]